ncbi:MAG: tetratricopeptide repeat protein [Bacteroidales bacterium]|nr:tetratricopeptide repeat protein [Bacteroidales bacterium]
MLTSIINKDLNKVDWLILRGNIYYIKQEYSKSLNDYNKVLKIDPKNKIISSKVEMIKDILKFQTLDIFASTNLNMDPWLDD